MEIVDAGRHNLGYNGLIITGRVQWPISIVWIDWENCAKRPTPKRSMLHQGVRRVLSRIVSAFSKTREGGFPDKALLGSKPVEQLVCERGQLADRTDGDRDTLLAEIRELYEKNDPNKIRNLRAGSNVDELEDVIMEQILCGGDYTPRLSWSRAGPALFSRCRSAYREKGWQQHFSIQWV